VGRVVAETPTTPTHLTWPGRTPENIDFTRR
jgi:cytosine/creatinine deaminase